MSTDISFYHLPKTCQPPAVGFRVAPASEFYLTVFRSTACLAQILSFGHYADILSKCLSSLPTTYKNKRTNADKNSGHGWPRTSNLDRIRVAD